MLEMTSKAFQYVKQVGLYVVNKERIKKEILLRKNDNNFVLQLFVSG